MEIFWQDVRYGVRMLVRTPVLTAIIAVTLGLGIGANTAIFSVVNALVLRPMAVPNPDELTVLAISHPGNEEPHGISYPDFQDYSKDSPAFSEFGAFDLGFIGVTHGERSERMIVSYVTGDFFKMLGVKPLLGRLILPTEGLSPGADPVMVLGYDCWKRKFNSDPNVVGQSIRVAGHAVTIVGVVPASFTGAYSVVVMEGYLPMGMNALTPDSANIFTQRDNHSLHVLARLKTGAGLKQAQASLAVIADHLAAQYPDTDKGNKVYVFPERLARPEPSSAQQNPLVAGIFLILVGLVLLVACVNVTNILLARAAAREKELAIRAAMGAGRARLIRQLLTESGMLALLGGATGLLFGWWASLGLQRIQIPGGIPFRIDLSFDWHTFSYVAAVALASGIVVGLVPALRASRSDLNQMLREGGRGMGGGIERHRVRNILVISQVAGSMILLIAGGLFIRSLKSAQTADLGIRTDHLISFSVDPEQINFDRAQTEQFYRELEGRVRALPGVMSASLAYSAPMGYYNLGGRVIAEGQTLAPGDKGPIAGWNFVGTDYLRTMNVRLLRGREFTDSDTEKSKPVAIINEELARKLWPGQDAMGKRFSMNGTKGPYLEVVGITPTGKYGFMFEDPMLYFFAPLTQNYQSLHLMQVRTSVPPTSLASALQSTVHELQPTLPVYDVMTMEERLQGGNGFFLLQMGAMFAGALGGLGLVLAVVGVYGVVSYSATQRTHEIGVRMALGAQRGDILQMVLRQGLILVAVGIGIGAAAALGLGRFMANLLFGIKPHDPLTYGLVALLLVTVAVVACLIPARRATRVDPMIALRYE